MALAITKYRMLSGGNGNQDLPQNLIVSASKNHVKKGHYAILWKQSNKTRRTIMPTEQPQQVIVKDIEDFDIGSITEKAMLVRLIRRQFINNVPEDEVSEHIHHQYKTADSSSIRATKSLFSRSSVSGYTRVMSDANVQFYNMTTPWADTGYRLLLVSNYNDFVTKMRSCIDRFNSSVDEFVKNYNSNKADAKEMLGTAYQDSDYPSEDALRNQFELTIKFTKIPDTNDIRLTMPKEDLDAAVGQYKEQIRQLKTQVKELSKTDKFGQFNSPVGDVHVSFPDDTEPAIDDSDEVLDIMGKVQ
jgi:hypothetical protein